MVLAKPLAAAYPNIILETFSYRVGIEIKTNLCFTPDDAILKNPKDQGLD